MPTILQPSICGPIEIGSVKVSDMNTFWKIVNNALQLMDRYRKEVIQVST